MLSEGQSRHVRKYRKLAKKNLFCRYLATILIVFEVIIAKIIKVNRGRIIAVFELCFVTAFFMFNSSFAPKSLGDDAVEIYYDASETQLMNAEVAGMSDILIDDMVDEHDWVDVTEDTANLDDLIEQNGQVEVSVEETSESPKFSKDDWNLVLINKQHTIPEDYQFTLGTLKGSMRCDERIIDPLTQMFAAAKEDGVNLIVCSPYRDMQRQEYLFERKIKNYLRTGMSYIDAYKAASITVTLPGASEHQVGLAVDIICDTYTALDENFGETSAGIWLKEHSWEYGFILRYPAGKESITGIQYEPWHFRYVGRDAASVITSEGITLEEFIENL